MSALAESNTIPLTNPAVPLSTGINRLNLTGSNNALLNVGFIITLCSIKGCIFGYRGDNTIVKICLMENWSIQVIPALAFVGAPYLDVSGNSLNVRIACVWAYRSVCIVCDVILCVCVWERKREFLCVYVWEREGKREGGGRGGRGR